MSRSARWWSCSCEFGSRRYFINTLCKVPFLSYDYVLFFFAGSLWDICKGCSCETCLLKCCKVHPFCYWPFPSAESSSCNQDLDCFTWFREGMLPPPPTPNPHQKNKIKMGEMPPSYVIAPLHLNPRPTHAHIPWTHTKSPYLPDIYAYGFLILYKPLTN